MKYNTNSTKYPVGGDVNRAVPGERGKGNSTSSVDFTGAGFTAPKQNAKESSNTSGSHSGPYGSK
jgi:hypothetical protein